MSRPCLVCGILSDMMCGEPVLPVALGPSPSLAAAVCGACAAARGAQDGALVDWVRDVARAGDPDAAALATPGLPLRLDGNSGAWLHVRFTEGRAEILPQLVLWGGGAAKFFADRGADAAVLLALLRRELADPASLTVETAVIVAPAGAAPPMQAAIVRVDERRYLLRAPDAATRDRLLAALPQRRRLGALAVPEDLLAGDVADGAIDARLVVDVELVERALARTALALVAHHVGQDALIAPALAPLRAFVDGKTGGAGLVELCPGRRGGDALVQRFARAHRHTLVLLEAATPPLVFVFLYGALVATVWPTAGAPLAATDVLVACTVDPRAATWRVLSVADDPEAFAREFDVEPESPRAILPPP